MDSNSPTDAQLVIETLAGRREAFGPLYDRYARLVASVAAGVSSDWPAAEDLVQECFLRAYRNLARLRDPDRFGAWITGIARQVGRERRRSLRRDRHEFQDPRTMQPDSPVTDVELFDREETEQVFRCIAQLGEQERIAIHAYFLQQQDAQAAAESLGLSRSGFYATVQRAVARLAHQLKPRENERLNR